MSIADTKLDSQEYWPLLSILNCLQAFIKSYRLHFRSCKCLLSTDSAGMGTDVPDITLALFIGKKFCFMASHINTSIGMRINLNIFQSNQ